MNAKELLDLANTGYPDGELTLRYDDEGRHIKGIPGDTLADFIIVELSETFEGETEKQQLGVAIEVLDMAIRNITSVQDALYERWEVTQ